MAIYIELGALIFALFLLYMLIQFLKNPLLILANSLLGFASFLLLNYYLGLGIAINIWSILVVGFGGFAGLVLVLILHFTGIAF